VHESATQSEAERILVLYDQVKTNGRRYQDFDDTHEARDFAERMRAAHSEIIDVQQSGRRVYLSEAGAGSLTT